MIVDAVFPRAEVIANLDDLTRAEWLRLRRDGLGGSDTAAVFGLSPWTSPYELWLDKTGQHPDQDDDGDGSTVRLRAGQHLEPFVIAESMREQPGLHVQRHPVMLGDPDDDCLFVDLDGTAEFANRIAEVGIFEAKTVHDRIQPQWDDGPPVYYTAQVAHALAVTGARFAVVGALFGLHTVRTYIIDRDEELIEQVRAAETDWWQRHVTDGHPPAVDGSKAATAALQLLQARAGTVATMDHSLDDVWATLSNAKQRLADWEYVDAKARNQIRAYMGEATELVDEHGERWATWRQGKDRTVIDWQLVAADLNDKLHDLGHDTPWLATAIEQHTTIRPGARTLRIDAGLKHLEDPDV